MQWCKHLGHSQLIFPPLRHHLISPPDPHPQAEWWGPVVFWCSQLFMCKADLMQGVLVLHKRPGENERGQGKCSANVYVLLSNKSRCGQQTGREELSVEWDSARLRSSCSSSSVSVLCLFVPSSLVSSHPAANHTPPRTTGNTQEQKKSHCQLCTLAHTSASVLGLLWSVGAPLWPYSKLCFKYTQICYVLSGVLMLGW